MHRLLTFLALLAGALASAGAAPLEPVTLQLKWKHQFQFAGYYMAVAKGYYRDAGFDVTLAEAQGEDTIATVLTGKAQYGVAGSELALRRAQGEPVVALATILQHSALALAVRGGSGQSVHDLAGRPVMLSPHDQELLAYLQREGLAGGRVKQVPMSFDVRDLIEGRVDGFSVYTTDQVWELRQSGLAYTLVSPRAGGIDFYGDTLFTAEQRVRTQRERVRAFRDASVRGWQYAMDHPEEAVDLILARYSRRLPREHLLFEAAEMKRLMQPQLVEIGHMNPGRWRHVAEVYAEIGMLPRDFSLNGFLFSAAGEDSTARDDPWLWALGTLALLALAASAHLAWRNRLLRQALQPGPGSASVLVPATRPLLYDPVTGLYSRGYLDGTLQRELDRAARAGLPLSVAVLEVDRLARLVDQDGPAAGDALLRLLTELLRQQMGPGEFACRFDAAALAWVLPGSGAADAATRARTITEGLAGQATWAGLIEVRGTASCRLAEFPADGADAPALLARLGPARAQP